MFKPSPTCMKEIGEPECGYCQMTMTDDSFFVGEAEKYHYNKKPWSQLREESVLMPAVESYAPWSIWAINGCKQFKCSDQVNRFKIKIDSLADLSNKTP